MTTRKTHRRTAAVLAGISIILLFAPLLIAAQDYLLTRRGADSIQPADTAVILSTKAYVEGRLNPCLTARVQAGAQLYRQGRVRKLLMSGGINRDHRYGAHVMRALALDMGIPESDIIQEDRSSTTFENIVFSTPLIENDRNIVIVSSGYHLPRALKTAKQQWKGKNIQTYAADFCSEPPRGYLYSLIRETGAWIKNTLKGNM